MERFQIARELALKYLKAADHMLTQTYPLVKDTKLLIAVLNNIFISAENTMDTMLYHDRLFKKIPPFHENFESRFYMFKMKCAPQNKLNEYISLIQETKELIEKHKQSNVEFSRKDAFVICDDDYRVKAITASELKNYIAKAKRFFSDVHNIVKKHERIFV